MVRHVSRASQRCGILIFVSLTERYARIVADDGVAAKIPQSEWQSIVDRLTTDLAAARIADGFAGAIASCGAVLARHFPPSPGQRNQLPDRLYVI